MAQASRHKPTKELGGELVEQIGEFISIEARLARAELSETSVKLLSSLGWLAGGLCVSLAALVILLAAAAAFLMKLRVAPDLACLIVAVIALAIGMVLIIWGTRSLRSAELVPARSLRQASSLAQLMKER